MDVLKQMISNGQRGRAQAWWGLQMSHTMSCRLTIMSVL